MSTRMSTIMFWQVCLFAFDCLYINGRSLLKEPFSERRKALYENFKEVEGRFLYAKHMTCDDTEQIQEFLDESIKGNCEGCRPPWINDLSTVSHHRPCSDCAATVQRLCSDCAVTVQRLCSDCAATVR